MTAPGAQGNCPAVQFLFYFFFFFLFVQSPSETARNRSASLPTLPINTLCLQPGVTSSPWQLGLKPFTK